VAKTEPAPPPETAPDVPQKEEEAS
jgi:hypothetical protein